MPTAIRTMDRSVRIRQGVILLVGALALQLLAGSDDPRLDFYWTPAIIGATYTLAAISGGRDGSYWSTGPVVLGWGATVVWLNEARPDVFASSAYAFGMGLGVLLSALAGRAGARIDPVAIGATATITGFIFMLDRRVEQIGDSTTFAISLAVVGAANLAFAARSK